MRPLTFFEKLVEKIKEIFQNILLDLRSIVADEDNRYY